MKRFLNIAAQLLCVIVFFSLVTPCSAREIELVWNANTEQDLAGYRIYYRTGSPGVCQSGVYNGAGLTYVGDPYDGMVVDSGFEIKKEDLDPGAETVTSRLAGLSDTESYYFVLTAYDSEGLESTNSEEVSVYAPKISNLNIEPKG